MKTRGHSPLTSAYATLLNVTLSVALDFVEVKLGNRVHGAHEVAAHLLVAILRVAILRVAILQSILILILAVAVLQIILIITFVGSWKGKV